MARPLDQLKPNTVIATDGTQLYYKEWGSGPPVILIHGWPLSADSWDDLAMALAHAGFRTIAYDRRGFGRSSQPWSGYDYDTLADDLASVIDQTGAEQCVLCGFSMGGGEVARYLTRYGPALVSKAILIGAVVPYMLKTDDNPHGTDETVFQQMTDGIAEDRAKFFGAFFKDFFGMGMLSKPVSDEMVEDARQVAMRAALPATLGCAQAFATTDFRPDMAGFTMPTLIIHGTADKTVPIDASARMAARAIPQATLLEYEGAPHGLFASEKEQLARDILEFLRA